MDKLTKSHRRTGLAIAERVSEIAAAAPDAVSKQLLYSAVTRLRLRYGLTPEAKAAEVTKYLRLGATTVDELSRETLLSRCEVTPILQDLESRGVVERRSIQASGAGRPAQCWFYAEGESDVG